MQRSIHIWHSKETIIPVTIGLRDVMLAAREIYAGIYPHLALYGDTDGAPLHYNSTQIADDQWATPAYCICIIQYILYYV